MLLLHRIRDRLVAERTAGINAIRGHMTEFGMVTAKGQAGLVELRSIIADPDDARLTPLARELLTLAVAHLRSLEEKIVDLDRQVGRLAREDANCRRLSEIPGVGPIVATGVLATAGDLRLFDSGLLGSRRIGSSEVRSRKRWPCSRQTVVPATMKRRRGSPAASSAAGSRSERPGAISTGYARDEVRTVSRTGVTVTGVGIRRMVG